MEWNLLPILNYEGKRLPVDITLNLSEQKGDDFRILESVSVKGEFVNVGGALEFHAECRAKLERPCDRCTAMCVQTLDFSVEERLKKADVYSDADSDPDVIMLSGSSVELDDMIYGALYMNLPVKVLCREDCKGLCTQCGANLNQGDCDCDDRPTDPRFDVLDQLL